MQGALKRQKLPQQPDEEHINSLLALGFKSDEVVRALKLTGNVERAANWLYQNM